MSLAQYFRWSFLAMGVHLAVAIPAQNRGWDRVQAQYAPSATRQAVPIGRVAANQALSVSVSLIPNDLAAFEAYAQAVNDPQSPLYRRYLTSEEVGQRFGASSETFSATRRYLESQGLRIQLASKNRLTIVAEGNAASIERAFRTPLVKFRPFGRRTGESRTFFANLDAPQLPQDIARNVTHVGGLDNANPPEMRALTAAQARTLYRLQSLTESGFYGQGRGVGISNWDGFRLSNLPPFYSQNRLPAPPNGVGSNVRVVKIGRGSGSGSCQGEGDLDIQMVLGAAPQCDLTVYDGTNDLVSVLAKEADENAVDVISESWGWKLSNSAKTAAHAQHLALTAQGITYVAASGDYGTELEPYDYPNFEPEVLLIGGTVATTDRDGNRLSEVGWSGSGGGYSLDSSTFNVKPAWQVGTGVPNINRRLGPDIAFHSAGTGAYPFFLNGIERSDYLGTSFAAPLVAGMIAVGEQKLAEQGAFGNGPSRLGRLQDRIYAMNGRSDVWFDVTQGQNGLLPNGQVSQAGLGWDTVTGWGPFDAPRFFDALAQEGVISPSTPYESTAVGIYNREARQARGTKEDLDAIDARTYELTSLLQSKVGIASAAVTFRLPQKASGQLSLSFNATAPTGTEIEVLLYNVKTRRYQSFGRLSPRSSGASNEVPFGDVKNFSDFGTVRCALRSTNSTSAGTARSGYRFLIDRSVLHLR